MYNKNLEHQRLKEFAGGVKQNEMFVKAENLGGKTDSASSNTANAVSPDDLLTTQDMLSQKPIVAKNKLNYNYYE
jgi:hypothetical protein